MFIPIKDLKGLSLKNEQQFKIGIRTRNATFFRELSYEIKKNGLVPKIRGQDTRTVCYK